MTNNVFHKVEQASFGIAMVLNLLALYLILTKSRKHIGQYRKLLFIFLVTGIIFAILYIIVQPTCIIRETALITYGTGWIPDARLVALYYGVVSMSFLIIAMQFVYRAMVLSSKTYSVIEITNTHIFLILLILASELIFWMLLCAKVLSYPNEYAPTVDRLTADLDDFPKSNRDKRLVMYVGYYGNDLWSIANDDYLVFSEVSTLPKIAYKKTELEYFSSSILRVLNDKQHTSSNWRKHNYQLFIALYFQFLGPLIHLYLPCLANLSLPFVTGHGFYSPSWVLSLLYSLYPIVDPLVMIISIRDYRRGFYNLRKKSRFLAIIG